MPSPTATSVHHKSAHCSANPGACAKPACHTRGVGCEATPREPGLHLGHSRREKKWQRRENTIPSSVHWCRQLWTRSWGCGLCGLRPRGPGPVPSFLWASAICKQTPYSPRLKALILSEHPSSWGLLSRIWGGAQSCSCDQGQRRYRKCRC